MIISGYTESRLNEVKTYDKTQPYQVGINGVTNVIYDNNTPPEPTLIEYTLNDIDYITNLGPPIISGTEFFKTETKYFFESSGCTEEEVNLIKQEVEIGVVFPPKIEKEIFIERMSISVFEPQSRLGEIGSLEQLETYRNGYYNIFNIEQ